MPRVSVRLRARIIGDTLTATGEMRQQGSRTGLYDITVTNQDGQTIAVFRGKSYRIKGDVLSGLT